MSSTSTFNFNEQLLETSITHMDSEIERLKKEITSLQMNLEIFMYTRAQLSCKLVDEKIKKSITENLVGINNVS